MDDNNFPGLNIEKSEITDKTKKLLARWGTNPEYYIEGITPYCHMSCINPKSFISEKDYKYFHHGYPDGQPTMGFFYWEGADPMRVKAEYPDTMTSEEKEAVLEYMRSSTEVNAWMGLATSRIEGENVFLGSRDMRTPDGKWIFPEKWDEHYVDKYDISPTREFVEDAVNWLNSYIHKENKVFLEDEITINQQDDINYFKNKATNAINDNDWNGLLIAAKKLKQLDESVIIYKLTRYSERNISGFPRCFTIVISNKNDQKTRWLNNQKWLSSRQYCDEFTSEEEAFDLIKNGSLPDIPEGYGPAYVLAYLKDNKSDD